MVLRSRGYSSGFKKINVLILASTFPRHEGDSTPAFVLDFAKSISSHYNVTILAPYDTKSLFRETMGQVDVWRFPYFIPQFQRLTYRGGLYSAFRESLLAKVQLPFFLISELLFAVYIIKKKRIKVVNPHWLFPQGLIGLLIKFILGNRLIITTHGGDVALLNSKSVKWLLKIILSKADLVTFVSEYTRTIANKAFGDSSRSESFKLMPMGIYTPKNIMRNKIKGKLKILFIGRLVEIKGLNYLIESISQIKKNYNNIELNILGEGPKKTDWINLTKKLHLEKCVFFNGYITGKRKYQYIKDSNILVVPSIRDRHGHEEGLPVVALEALAYGKVLIATETGGLRFLINKENGILVKPSSSDSITQAIVTIIENRISISDISQSASRTGREYDWKKIAGLFHKYIESIL